MVKLNFFIEGPIDSTNLNALAGEANIVALATDHSVTSINILDNNSATYPACNIF